MKRQFQQSRYYNQHARSMRASSPFGDIAKSRRARGTRKRVVAEVSHDEAERGE